MHVHELVLQDKHGRYFGLVIIFNFFGIFSALISAYIVQADCYYLLSFLSVTVAIALNFPNKASSSRLLTKSNDPPKSEIVFGREFLSSLFCQASDKYSKKRLLLAGLVCSAYLLIICKLLEDSIFSFIKLVFLTFLALFTSMHISISTVILPSISTNSKTTNLVSRKIKLYCIFRFKSFFRSVLSFEEQPNDKFCLLYETLKKNWEKQYI